VPSTGKPKNVTDLVTPRDIAPYPFNQMI